MSIQAGETYLRTIDRSLEKGKFSGTFLWDLLFLAAENITAGFFSQDDVPHSMGTRIGKLEERGILKGETSRVLHDMSLQSSLCSGLPDYSQLDFSQCLTAVKSLKESTNVYRN